MVLGSCFRACLCCLLDPELVEDRVGDAGRLLLDGRDFVGEARVDAAGRLLLDRCDFAGAVAAAGACCSYEKANAARGLPGPRRLCP